MMIAAQTKCTLTEIRLFRTSHILLKLEIDTRIGMDVLASRVNPLISLYRAQASAYARGGPNVIRVKLANFTNETEIGGVITNPRVEYIIRLIMAKVEEVLASN